MLKLTKEIVNKLTFLDFIKIEKDSIYSSMSVQEIFNKKLLSYLKSFTLSLGYEPLSNEQDEKLDILNETTQMIKLSNSNILSLNELINILDEFSNDPFLENSSNFKKMEKKLKDYNNKYSSTFLEISSNTNIIKFFLSKNFTEDELNELKNIEHQKATEKNLNIQYPENTLIISEMENKVFLPYKNEEIISIIKNENIDLKTESEIIDNYYTIPYSKYKASSFSRFKEGYKLIREKERGSIPQALELGLELFSNYNLHPAIVSACKNLNELDVYLSCLEYNELDDFNFFKIEFKSTPYNTKFKL